MKLLYKSIENQYSELNFDTDKMVFAQYSKSIIKAENGNPFIEAIPPVMDKERFFVRNIKLIKDDKRKTLSSIEKEDKIQQLKNIRVPMPYAYQMYKAFNAALKTTYNSRNVRKVTESYTINDKEKDMIVKSITNYDGDHSNGFTLIGASGCGKSTSIKMMLSQYPQVIIHYDVNYGQFVQILYIKVNCLPNSNLVELLNNIGKEIDIALNNTTAIYEMIVNKAKTIGRKVGIICDLIEKFNIGALILDEIQFLDFSANKDASFESILAISNNTKVSIIASGTDDTYGKMFPNLRTSRRTGICIRADSYCSDISCFNSLINILWQHHIFDDASITIPIDVKEGIYKASKGIIDQVIKIFIQMEIEYLQAQYKPQIDGEFVYKIVNKYYPGTILHLKKKIVNSLTSDNNKGELTTFEIKCINMLKDILNVTDERFNDHSIANSVRIAHKRSPNANESQIAKLAYNHLKRHKSDNRYEFKRDLEYEDERELILNAAERL